VTVPDYEALMRPLLELSTSGREMHIKDAVSSLSDRFCLSQDDRLKLLPSGRVTLIRNRAQWARMYLTKAGLLESTRRGYFRRSLSL
jgi:restriction system protein